MPFYNGPTRRGVVALVGGPYESRDAAIAELRHDRIFVCEHTKDGAREGDFGDWFAVELAPLASDGKPWRTARACWAAGPGWQPHLVALPQGGA